MYLEYGRKPEYMDTKPRTLDENMQTPHARPVLRLEPLNLRTVSLKKNKLVKTYWSENGIIVNNPFRAAQLQRNTTAHSHSRDDYS